MINLDESIDALKSELRRERSINERLQMKAKAYNRLTTITIPEFFAFVSVFVIPAILIDFGLL